MAYATVIKPKQKKVSVIPEQVDQPAPEMIPSAYSSLTTEEMANVVNCLSNQQRGLTVMRTQNQTITTHRRVSEASTQKTKKTSNKKNLSPPPRKRSHTSSEKGIYYRASSWRFFIYVDDPDRRGKKKQVWRCGFQSKDEAIHAREEELRDLERGIVVDRKEEKLKSYINKWLNDRKKSLKPSTLRGYKENIDLYIIPNLGHLRLSDIFRSDVQHMVNVMSKKGLSKATAKYAVRVLSCCMNDAIADRLIAFSPCTRINYPLEAPFQSTILDEEQIKKLLDGLDNSSCSLIIEAAIVLGLRRGEALGLKFSDFDMDKQTVRIQRQITETKNPLENGNSQQRFGETTVKTAAGNRIIGVPRTFLKKIAAKERWNKANRLKAGSKYSKDPYLFSDKLGNFINPQTLNKFFKKKLVQLNLPDMRFHDLRHTNATLLVHSEGADLKAISAGLGHSSIRVTMDMYANNIPEAMERTAGIVQSKMYGSDNSNRPDKMIITSPS